MRSNERRKIVNNQPDNLIDSIQSNVVDGNLVKRHGPLIFAMAIGMIVMVVASLFLYVFSEKISAFERINAMRQSTFLKERIVSFIEHNNMALQELRIAIVRSKLISNDKFRTVSAKIIQKNPYIKLVTWAPNGVIRNVHPLGLNKGLLLSKSDAAVLSSYRSNPDSLQLVVEGEREGQPNLSMNGLLFNEKISADGNGLLTLKVDIYHFLKDDVLKDMTLIQPFIIKQQYSTSSIYKVGDQALFNTDNLESVQLTAGDTNWEIHTLVKLDDSSDLTASWLLASLLSLILTLFSHRVLSIYKQRSVDVKAGAYRANFDLLTGLPNRYHFSRHLRETIEEAQREQSDFAVFFMDIDHFKEMNDQLGQGAGDAILTEFSTRLEFTANNNDLIARISGDEFIYVARQVDDVIKADLLAEKLKKHLQQPIDFAGQQHFITVSMGIAMYPIDGDDVPSLLHHSDQAMYEAKRAGRNRHFFFNESMRDQAETYLTIHKDLLRGLKAGEFELYYQPVLNTQTQTVDICEALIRWNHPERGLVMPDKFISVAERTGAIRDIGNWAFGQACRDIREFTESDINVKIAINHSISEYYSNRAFERWKSILNENFVSGDKFIFEIPEALLMDKKSIRMNVVSAMRKMGVQFAIDDFGTGHSAINYLRNYPADILKIDSSLINGMQESSKDRVLVEVVLTLAKSLGKKVVAEGVENDRVAAQLKDLNCDYLQGNWFLEPKPINRLIPYIHQHMFAIEEQEDALNSSINDSI